MRVAVVALGVVPDLEAELRGAHVSIDALRNCGIRHNAVRGAGLVSTGKGYSKRQIKG